MLTAFKSKRGLYILLSMKILAFDISKKATGVAFYDGTLDSDSLETIEFKDSVSWGKRIGEIIDKWNPDVITFSETVNRMCSHTTKRILYGLMFMLEHLAYKREIHIIPINDSQAKGFICIKFRKRIDIKDATIKWANQTFDIEATEDEADAISFAHYMNNVLSD